MKNLVYIAVLALVLTSCGTTKNSTPSPEPIAPTDANVTVGKATKLATTKPLRDMPVVTPTDIENPKEIKQVPPPNMGVPATEIENKDEEKTIEPIPSAPGIVEAFDHVSFNELLKGNVSTEGIVDYNGFRKNRTVLRLYIAALGKRMPQDSWSKEDKLSYWMNAYNAMTIDLILRNQPVASIKDIKDPWKQRLWKLGEKWYNLDEIEHKILRKMGDARIHFGINCASFSCPPLLNEAFTAATVDSQLDTLARRFINDSSRNIITPDRVTVSKIFSWFAKDFKENGSLIDFLNNYATTPINTKAKVRYMDYNWELNN